MNEQYFLIVAGEEVSKMLDKRATEEINSELGLVEWQVKINTEGYRYAELVKSDHGWTLRHGSGLQDFKIIHRTGSDDFERARKVAEQWVSYDPAHRYAFVRRSAFK